MELHIQKMYQGDSRKWEEIPVEPLDLEDADDMVMSEVEEWLMGYLKIWNRLNSHSSCRISQIRLSRSDSYQGHYIIDHKFF